MTLNLNAIKDPLAGEKINLRRGVDLQVCHSHAQTPALVFLHGGLGNRFNWRSQYKFFQSQGREVLVYDLARHEQSQPYNRSLLCGKALQRFNVTGVAGSLPHPVPHFILPQLWCTYRSRVGKATSS
jgi:pimeloyl-ACP methyl ester carboxylesterase